MSLSGVLTTFSCGSYTYPIFTSGDLTAERAVVFIGGLTNGIGAVPFTYPLEGALKTAGWKFIQFHWSSAYGGYGTGSLDRDRAEMQILVKHLKTTGLKTIVIMGHSTGSQNVIHYLSSPDNNKNEYHAEGGIMQAPVSDREYCSDYKHYLDYLPVAEQWIKEGKGNQILPDEFCKTAGFDDVEMKMTAYRLWSLIGKGGDDDYFSADIPVDPSSPFVHSLSTSFGALTAPVLALYAEKDTKHQVAPPEKRLTEWEKAARGKLDWKILKGASHDVSEEEPQKALNREVLFWLKRFE
ncbi:uncharacterized protein L203_102805 [Cryptococcus depauperatus CBS 7841]|uniref:Uncharacterized protein n=1 Tax=Cryptococcus depauperatus CBS 7841 TaxID=1295531 RepID=A0A1E3IAV2_9TREE|nr:dolichol-phosphate mannosyltransferase [Cryptococcus depauperatus CBS 7841]